MYAKVHKSKKKDETDRTSKESANRSSVSSSNAVESKKHEPKPNLGTSEIDGMPLHREHNYETIRKSTSKCSDPGYEKIKNGKDDCSTEPGYASINGPSSILSSDPGYEVLKERAASELDPNYEELRGRTSSVSDCGGYSRIQPKNSATDGYSVVNKNSNSKSGTSSSYGSEIKDLSFDEPNYESMPSESAFEHSYSALRSTGSESDPNYESVNHSDPNYESVKYLEAAIRDPPYERLQDDDSSRSNGKVQSEEDFAGYETIRDTKNNSEQSEPPYEQLYNELGKTESQVAEKVQSSENSHRIGKSNTSNDGNGDSDDDGIIQV